MRFSQRHGFRPVKDVIQRDSMDTDLRVGLWNVLSLALFAEGDNYELAYVPDYKNLAIAIWHSFFKRPVDKIPSTWGGVQATLRSYFFECSWDEAYDFIEFVADRTSPWPNSERFHNGVNSILEREMSAWRMVGGRITEVTSPTEIVEIERALGDSRQPIRTHLQSALSLLSDRHNPDYRNSIKESISAVEALVNTITGSRGTLGAAMKKLGIGHAALETALSKLYGYTSDAEGIRHALMDEPHLESEDARFMLVLCSAFVNYLSEKARRAGIKV